MTFNLNDIEKQLTSLTKDDTGIGVSFAKKSLKLDSEEDALEIIKAIKACPNLEFLDLEGNTLGPLAAKAIAEALRINGSTLKRALWKDMFTGRLKTEIPKALDYLGNALYGAGTQLVELDLSDNAFGPIGVEVLGTFLSSSSCYTLSELRLNNNGLGISGGKMLAKALLDCYNNSIQAGKSPLALKVFIAGRNRLENEGAEALASVFRKLTSLEEVVMPQNGIYHQGITALANGLSTNTNLRILNLNDNTVRLKGAEAIAKALPNFRNLELLNLGDCLIKTKGCLVLAEALGVVGNHPSLIEVNLSSNEIMDKAAIPLAHAMADKESLITLQLNGNYFGTKGRAILRDSLKNCQRIASLSTLSDDESNSEDEEEDEDEEVEDEEEEEGHENEDKSGGNGTENETIVENDNNKQDLKTQTKVSVADFLKSPTGEKLLLLQNDAVKAFIEYAKNISKNTDISQESKFIEEMTRIIMKVSTFCESGYITVRLKAEVLTDALYSELCNFAIENNQISNWNNALLVNLGLIKSEDKNCKTINWNLEGCFKALEKITQRDYFPEQTRNTLKCFLEKPMKISKSKVMDPLQHSKDSLRAVLDRAQNT